MFCSGGTRETAYVSKTCDLQSAGPDSGAGVRGPGPAAAAIFRRHGRHGREKWRERHRKGLFFPAKDAHGYDRPGKEHQHDQQREHANQLYDHARSAHVHRDARQSAQSHDAENTEYRQLIRRAESLRQAEGRHL